MNGATNHSRARSRRRALTAFGALGMGTCLLAGLAACGSTSAGTPTESVSPEGTTAALSAGDWTETLVPGPEKPEDLVALESGALVVSGMGGDPGSGDGPAGSLYSLDPESRALEGLWPTGDLEVDHDEGRFADCSEPPAAEDASPHGLGREVADDGTEYLYVVNHGEREAIEVFTVGGKSEAPSLTWVGCSELPEGAFGNGVAPDPDGDGFYVTHFLDTSDMMAQFERAFAGQETGHVLHWSPDTGWSTVKGTEMSTPNGIAVSEDGTSLYVASWGGREIVEVDVESGEHLASTSIELMPDNLRATDDGTLLVTGQVIDEFETFVQYESGERTPEDRYDVYELDPETFAVERIAHGTPEGFGNPTTAVQVKGGLLVGSVAGENILQLQQK